MLVKNTTLGEKRRKIIHEQNCLRPRVACKKYHSGRKTSENYSRAEIPEATSCLGSSSTLFGIPINPFWGPHQPFLGSPSNLFGIPINAFWNSHQPLLGSPSTPFGIPINPFWDPHQPFLGSPSILLGIPINPFWDPHQPFLGFLVNPIGTPC